MNENLVQLKKGEGMSVIGNDNSILEVVYSLIYLVTFVSAPGAAIGIIAAAMVYKYLVVWAALLVGMAVGVLSIAIMCGLMFYALTAVLRSMATQPRDADGRFREIPVYDHGKHKFSLISAVKRQKKRS